MADETGQPRTPPALDNELPHPLPPKFGTEIFRCQVGSGVYGTGQDGYDDRDEMGMCVEPPSYLLGLKSMRQPAGQTWVEHTGEGFRQYVYRTQLDGARSGYGDLDLTVYSLRKWAKLAAAGNPTVLIPLFVPDNEVVVQTDMGRQMRLQPERFITRYTAARFLGYLRSQRDQLLGLTGRTHTNRPELVDRFGFDTKFAYHMVRLGMQGVELCDHGRITIPIPEPHLQWLRELRQGKHTKDEALAHAAYYEQLLLRHTKNEALPPTADYEALDRWLTRMYLQAWDMNLKEGDF